MNSYTKHYINSFFYKYNSRKFDQDDIALFLILVRDYTPKNSVFRELGDFLCHPDKKDRGLVINSIKPIVDFFENNADLVMSGEDFDVKRPNGIDALEDILSSLNHIFSMCELTLETTNKNDLRFRDLIFCLIFMLGNFKLEINNQLLDLTVYYGNSLELSIAYESSILKRNYLEISVLFLNAVWITNSSQNWNKLDSYIVRRFSNGILAAIPYSIDTEDLSDDMNSFERGVIWPLPDYR